MAQAPSADAALPRVVVSATRFADDADQLPVGISVLTAKEIRDAGVGTVNEAIMKLLGVPGRQDPYGGGDYALDLRGFGGNADSNQVVVVDGVRLNEADLGGTRIAGIAIDSVERIEVLRGSGSVMYGEGATGGVIVITTKSGANKSRRDQAQVYAALGSHRLREARATGTLVAGDVSLDLSLNSNRTDNHRDNFHTQTEGASATLQWAVDGLRLGSRIAYDDLDSGLPGALTAAQYAVNPRQTSHPGDHGDIRSVRESLFAEATLGAWQLGADLGWRQKELRSVNFGFPYDYDVNARTGALRARHQSQWGTVRQVLTLGYDRNAWTRESFGTATAASTALYAQDELSFATGTRLTAGVRKEHGRKANGPLLDERKTAWELGVLQAVAPGVAVYGRWGSSFRLPNVDEFSFTAPGVTLKAQSSRDAEVGARWTRQSDRVELRVYRSRLTQEIGYDPTAPGPFGPGANTNFDPTRRQGVELEGQHAVNAALQLRANLAWRQATFRAGPYAGRQVALVPNGTLALRADWKPGQDHLVGAVFNAVGPQYPDFANACRMPGYTTIDLRYAYQWGPAQWALGVGNLADRKYYTQAYACTAGVTDAIYPEAGRTLKASVRTQF